MKAPADPLLLLAPLLALSLAPPAGAQELAPEKYRLDNGMTVILHQDRRLPVAAINLWYRVGAKDEPPGRSGFAHLFEHLMFMGTERVPEGQFDAIMETGGGSNNASTSSDYTNYFSSGPAGLLPTLLWLDADRLADLARTMDQRKLDLQRDVVRNERRQNYENQPYGKAELVIPGLVYPAGHPYHIPVIGTHADLEAATVQDVKDFFATFYVPNNATLVVAGDFDRDATAQRIQDLFGTLPRGAEVARSRPARVALDGPRRTTVVDDVQLPRLTFVWHSPPRYAAGDAELELCAAVLGHGTTSRLYEKLVRDERLAVHVSARQDGAALGSLFRIDVTAMPDADLDRIERLVAELIDGFAVNPDELRERIAVREQRFLARLQDVGAIADLLNEYEFFLGDPGSLRADLDRFRGASTFGVALHARAVFAAPGLVVRVLPTAPARPPSARDARPELAQPGAFAPPAPERFTLSNGLPVALWPKRDLPLVAVRLVARPGGALDPAGQAGLAALTADMLDEGAGERDAVAFGRALSALGASLGTFVDRETASLTLDVLARNARPALALFAEAVRAPRFSADDWERVVRLHRERLRQQDDEPTTVADRLALRAMFGDSPYGLPIDGTEASVAGFALGDARDMFARVYRPEHALLLVAGDVDAAGARAALEDALGGWRAPPAPEPVVAIPSPTFAGQGLRVVVVDRPGAVQTVIRLAGPGVPFRDPARVELSMLDTILGGTFTSRLNQNLRERNGFTYGAGAQFVFEPSAGWFVAATSVRADVTGAAIKELLAEVAGIARGDVTPDEAEKARATIRNDTVEAFQSLGGTLERAAKSWVGGLPFETLALDLAELERHDADRLNVRARAALDLERSVLVLVGDRGEIERQTAGLGLARPVEWTPAGVPASGR